MTVRLTRAQLESITRMRVTMEWAFSPWWARLGGRLIALYALALALGLLAPASAGANTISRKVVAKPNGSSLRVKVSGKAKVTWRIGGLDGYVQRGPCTGSWADGETYVSITSCGGPVVRVRAFGRGGRFNLRVIATIPPKPTTASTPPPVEPTCLTEYEAQLKTTEVVQGLAPLIPDPADPTGTKLVPASGGFSGGRGSDTCTDAVYPTGGTECTRQSPMRVTCLGQWNVPTNPTPPYGVLTLRFAQVAVSKGPDGTLTAVTTEAVGDV